MPAGASFGDYRLIKRLAAGGTSEVFLARHKDAAATVRPVALKRVLPALREDAELARNFLEEARLAAQLDHPSLVTVQTVGRVEGSSFLVMELVRGANLAEITQALGGKWAWPECGRAIAFVCEGLEYLHAARAQDGTELELVHGDVNPANLMLGYGGGLKVVDFGSLRGAHRRPTPGTRELKRAWAAPEQVAGSRLDARTDVHGVALTLYGLLSGESPFARSTLAECLEAVVNEVPVALRSRRSEIPRALSALVAAGLEKRPADRPASVNAFRLELETCLRKAEPVGTPELARMMGALYPGQGRLNLAAPADPDAATVQTRATRHQSKRTVPLPSK